MATPGRALIIVENLPVPFDRRVWLEAGTLRDAGWEVSVICPTGKGFDARYELLEGIHVHRHPLPPETHSSGMAYLREYTTALFWEFRLARRIRRERGFDVVHLCNPPDLLFLVAGWFKLLHGARVVYDQHDLNPELYVAKFGRKDLFYAALRLAERMTYALADSVIATNPSHREIALGRGRRRPEQVFTVQSGPNLDRFRPVPENPVYRRGRRFLVGYVGVMGEQEGIDGLLETVRWLVHERGRTDIHFMLLGGGPALESLRALADRLEVSANVEFVGWCYGDEMIERLSSCDVCVSPDPRTEYSDRCTMNKVLEYMALAKPIVQYGLVEARRSAEDAALYAEDGDTAGFGALIERLLADPALRARLGVIGRARIESELAWTHQAPHLLRAYAAARGQALTPAGSAA